MFIVGFSSNDNHFDLHDVWKNTYYWHKTIMENKVYDTYFLNYYNNVFKMHVVEICLRNVPWCILDVKGGKKIIKPTDVHLKFKLFEYYILPAKQITDTFLWVVLFFILFKNTPSFSENLCQSHTFRWIFYLIQTNKKSSPAVI